MIENLLPDELMIRRTIAERDRELKLLRSVHRALARYRDERERAAAIKRESQTAQKSTRERKGGRP